LLPSTNENSALSVLNWNGNVQNLTVCDDGLDDKLGSVAHQCV